ERAHRGQREQPAFEVGELEGGCPHDPERPRGDRAPAAPAPGDPVGEQEQVVRPRRDRADEREPGQPEQLVHGPQWTTAGRARSCTILTMEWIRAWKPVVAGVHEVFHAHFEEYA